MTDMRNFLKELRKKDRLQDIDLAFADLISRTAGDPADPAPVLLAALVSNALTQRGETALSEEQIADADALAAYLDLPQGTELPVPANGWLPDPGRYPWILSDGSTPAPLVRRNGLVYLGRCFQNEAYLRDYLLRHTGPGTGAAVTESADDCKKITDLPLGEEQIRAIELARNTRFLTISGGPGTGKTTIIAVILALRPEKPEEIVLCAPTGKAQMRMKQSLNRQISALHTGPERIAELSGITSSTIHRLLGWDPWTGTFRHDRNDPLPYSLVIVDECSMIPISLMKSLLDAVPENGTVILLGDRHQLASVEPGSVFGDFCDILRSCPDHLAELTLSHRFREGEGICMLKNRINSGEAKEAAELLLHGGSPQLKHVPPPKAKELPELLRAEFDGTWIRDGKPYYQEETLEDAWSRFEQFRILTPLNSGPLGTDKLNRQAGLVLGFPENEPQAGKAFLILENDYQTGLFNGDTGLLWYAGPDGQPLTREAARQQGHPELRVFFPGIGRDGSQIWHGVAPNCLPEHTKAYAFTIHKSQGSDYDRILVFLPEPEGGRKEFLNRPLLYTGITRAKKHVTAAVSGETFQTAVLRVTERTSGLRKLYEEALGKTE
ncbi:MAG: exodeoxyribonuclease V subunit alpha [Lentisphaeria bacterium]|nr:exodeoxyribonuclease V subunit alpha [Lentisphaeria bacterium]